MRWGVLPFALRRDPIELGPTVGMQLQQLQHVHADDPRRRRRGHSNRRRRRDADDSGGRRRGHRDRRRRGQSDKDGPSPADLE